MAKTYKGGYKIISLAGLSLVAGAEALTIKGIHHSIEASYGKPLLVEDIVVDGVEKNDVWVKELKVVDGAFVIELYGLKLTITDDDEVTVEEIIEPTPKILEPQTISNETVAYHLNDGESQKVTLEKATINFDAGAMGIVNTGDGDSISLTLSSEDYITFGEAGAVTVLITKINGIYLVMNLQEL